MVKIVPRENGTRKNFLATNATIAAPAGTKTNGPSRAVANTAPRGTTRVPTGKPVATLAPRASSKMPTLNPGAKVAWRACTKTPPRLPLAKRARRDGRRRTILPPNAPPRRPGRTNLATFTPYFIDASVGSTRTKPPKRPANSASLVSIKFTIRRPRACCAPKGTTTTKWATIKLKVAPPAPRARFLWRRPPCASPAPRGTTWRVPAKVRAWPACPVFIKPLRARASRAKDAPRANIKTTMAKPPVRIAPWGFTNPPPAKPAATPAWSGSTNTSMPSSLA